MFKLKSLQNILSILISFTFLRLYFEEFNSKLTINNNIRGDVEAVFFEQAKNIYESNKGSILRTIIYTIGHFAIAITVLMLIANVSFMIALTTTTN